jgi:hypothetical protein
MSERSVHRAMSALSVLTLAASLGACAETTVWTGPGWYLEMPRPLYVAGPRIFSGPYSYDQCEEERMKATTPDRMLCIREMVHPGSLGPYSPASRRPVPSPPPESAVPPSKDPG